MSPFKGTDKVWETSYKEHRNPLYMYVLDLHHVIGQCSARWIQSSMSTTGDVLNKFLGPNKPNYHIAAVCRGLVLIHGDIAIDNPNHAGINLNRSDTILSQLDKKWPLFYIVSADSV